MIRIPAEAVEAIRAHATATYPEECCGALIGQSSATGKSVRAVRPLQNSGAEQRERRFEVRPDAMREVERAAEADGLEVIGIYHSHPEHPAAPSEHDRDHAWPWYSYVIVRVVRGESKDLTSWILSDDRARFFEEEVLCQ